MKRFLVAVDASPRAPFVAQAAAALAAHSGATLVLFHAVGVPHGVPKEAYSLSPEALAEFLDAQGTKFLQGIAANLPKDISVEIVVEDGIGWRAICAAAERHKVDLIVIGSHGYSGVDRVLGTTASKVVNHSTHSVLVVR